MTVYEYDTDSILPQYYPISFEIPRFTPKRIYRKLHKVRVQTKNLYPVFYVCGLLNLVNLQ